MLYGCIKMGQFDESEGARGMVAGANNQTKSNKTMLQTNIAVSRPRCWWDRGGDPASFSSTSTSQRALPESKPREQSNEDFKQTHVAARSYLGRCCVPGRHRSLDA